MTKGKKSCMTEDRIKVCISDDFKKTYNWIVAKHCVDVAFRNWMISVSNGVIPVERVDYWKRFSKQ
jgi:hypothetical protein